MLSTQGFDEKKFLNLYNQLSVFDLIVLKLLLNYNKLLYLSVGFLLLTFTNVPLLQSLGWICYLHLTVAIIFIEFRYQRPMIGFLFSAVFLLNLVKFFGLIIKNQV